MITHELFCRIIGKDKDYNKFGIFIALINKIIFQLVKNFRHLIAINIP